MVEHVWDAMQLQQIGVLCAVRERDGCRVVLVFAARLAFIPHVAFGRWLAAIDCDA
jgi:hypothetical protein